MILRTSDLATAQSRISNEGLMVRTALTRCLHWQGRADDATMIIEREVGPHADGQCSANREESVSSISRAAEEPAHLIRLEPTQVVRWHAVAAEIAIQRRALEEAALHVNAAVAASSDDQPLERCVAHMVAVSFHGRVGDAEAARLHAAHALKAARAAHAPIEALRLRMNLSVALEQAGARSDAHAMARRLLRVKQSRIPALLGCQLGLALARTLPDSAVARGRGAQAEAFARAIGAAGLLSVMSTQQGLPKPLSDIIEVVRSTQDYEDEGALLERVAQLLRNRLGALSVAFTPAQDADTAVVSAGSGRGSGPPRAMNAGVLLGPLRTSAGIEIAAPIRCGGTTVGALGCRWSAAGPDNAEHARALIATTAIVSGPFLKALLDRRLAPPESQQCPELLGISAAMTELRRAIARTAAAPFPVLIVGESGVGKELVARAIHRESPRRLRHFVPLNCAAVTEDLVEAELFGHARGAFTGAVAERRGIFEEADGGTVFLDEVSELSPRAQAKLLRVLQEGEVRRVGESFARHIDVRIVAATNRTLDGETAPRQFRQDLRYRLDVIRLEVPPLRQRVEDIPVLAKAFWARVAPLTGCRAMLGSSAIATLAQYDWPGNVRELQNVIAALVVAAPRHGRVTASALPSAIARSATMLGATSLDDARLAFERRFVAAALARAGGKSARAARELGMTRQGLAKLVKRLGIHGISISNSEYRIPKTESRTEDSV
jgi:DNA-binding NtrC family response regulator